MPDPGTATRLQRMLLENWAWMLMLAPVVLLITKADYTYPVAVMALIGCYRLLSRPALVLADRRVKLFSTAFLLVWLPMLFSLADAVNAGHSAVTVLSHGRFYFAGIFMLQELSRQETVDRFLTGLFIVVTCWTADALVQLVAGRDLFDYPAAGNGLTGMFYPKTRIGHVLAVFSPLYFDYLRRRLTYKPLAVLLLLALLAVIVLSGKRVAWLMLFISLCATFLFLAIPGGKRLSVYLAGLVLGLTAILYGGSLLYPPLADRLQRTAGVFSTDYADIDRATAHRLSLWKISLRIGTENWINGIGPRGFRYAVPDYAGSDNFWISNGRTGTTHPHQFVLEIFAETGLPGIAGYVLLCILLLRLLLRGMRQGPPVLVPAFLACAIALLPLNSHLAFYGSYWSTITWLLLTLFIAVCRPETVTDDR